MGFREGFAAAVVLFVAGSLASAQTVYKQGEQGVSAPGLLKETKPKYTEQAMRARVEGVVRMSCVVSTEGRASDIKVIDSLHPQLDEEAIEAVKEWEFRPGTKDGVAVPVRIEIEMSFSLRRSPGDRVRLGAEGVFRKEDAGVVMPVVLADVKPSYTAQTMREKVVGTVTIDCVVLPDGTVGDARVATALHPQLDEEALRAVRKWRFKPGTKDNVPVPVQVQITMTFNLK